jgi:xylulokinase
MSCYIGIDLGTSNVKVILLSDSGEQLALASRSYPTHQPKAEQAEQSPSEWWEATCTCIREVMACQVAIHSMPLGIGLSGQMHGLVLLDKSGQPLRDAIIWPDRRSAKRCTERSVLSRTASYRAISGLPLATGFLGPSLEWVREHEPDLYKNAACFILPKDYLRFRLTGILGTDATDACGTYLFDIGRGVWSDVLFTEFGLNIDLAPEILGTLTVGGTVTRKAAGETGLSAGIPVIVGGSDQAMAALALGVVKPGRAAVAISTGGTLITTVNAPITDQRIHTLRHAYPDRWLFMGATLAAGSALAWFNDKVLTPGTGGTKPSLEELGLEAESVTPGSDGLLFAPYLSGERTPHLNPRAKASFIGLSLNHTRAHMIRAIMEGVAYSLNDSLQVFRDLDVRVDELYCYGGGAKSSTWRQIIADVFELPVHWEKGSEQSATGAAIAAAEALGGKLGADNGIGRDTVLVEPRPHTSDIYRARLKTFKSSYVQLRSIFDELV